MEDVPSDDNLELDDLKGDSDCFSTNEEYMEFSLEMASIDFEDNDDDSDGDDDGDEKPSSDTRRKESSSSVVSESPKTSAGTLERRRSRREERKAMRDRNQSPSATARTRRCDRGVRQERVRRNSIGPMTPTAAVQGRRSISNSPHQLRRTRTVQPRRRNSGGVLLRTTQPSRSRSADDDFPEKPVSPSEASAALEDRSIRSRRSSLRKQGKSPGSVRNLNSSVSMLYSGNTSASHLLTPDLDDGGNDSGPEDSGEVSEDGAELVRDELADIEGLVEAAKGVSVSS
jgi:hypothetical protein